MAIQSKPLSGRGALNVALNVFVKRKTILNYSVAQTSGTTIEVTIDKGADQAEVLKQVRDALPAEFSDAQVRTRIG